ncbi:MAG: hypothetical protein LBW85_01875 [Deltaproteobacteria bacterium]|jgi:hypothetical protein|nr:hypothetical protein [Deltaproteobacteria bacterium]
MQVDNRNSYNTLGRLGPLYPRPEYRPPQNSPENAPEGAGAGAGQGAEGKAKAQSESLILSPRLRKATAGQVREAQGKLGLQAAKELAEETARDITGLDPRSEYGCPHRKPEGHGLLYPVYA